MKLIRKMKALALVFALLALFAGAFTTLAPQKADAALGCCIWVMYCTVEPPIYCWCECVPVPCF